MSNISTSFGKFKTEYFKKDKNYLKAHVFKNPIFQRGRNDNGILDEAFFGNNLSYDDFTKLSRLKLDDFFIRNRPKSLHETNLEYGINLSLVSYMRLHESLQFYKDKKRDDNPGPSVSLEFFLKTFTKGSKPFRHVLKFGEFSKLNIANLNTVKTFFSITGLQASVAEQLRKSWGFWNKGYLGNKCREFLFKFHNNILGTNERVSKFIAGHNPECTLCETGNEPRPRPSETFCHIFFECPYSSRYRNAIENKFFPELNGADPSVKKLFWFTSALPSNRELKYNEFISAVVAVSNYYIWTAKLQKNLLSVNIVLIDLEWKICKMLGVSKKLLASKQNSDAFVCRYDFFRAGGRGDPP